VDTMKRLLEILMHEVGGDATHHILVDYAANDDENFGSDRVSSFKIPPGIPTDDLRVWMVPVDLHPDPNVPDTHIEVAETWHDLGADCRHIHPGTSYN
jgi:hypothetical protein